MSIILLLLATASILYGAPNTIQLHTQLAIKRKLTVIIIQEENRDIPPNIQELNEIKIFSRPIRGDPEAIKSFVKNLEDLLRGISPNLIENYFINLKGYYLKEIIYLQNFVFSLL